MIHILCQNLLIHHVVSQKDSPLTCNNLSVPCTLCSGPRRRISLLERRSMRSRVSYVPPDTRQLPSPHGPMGRSIRRHCRAPRAYSLTSVISSDRSLFKFGHIRKNGSRQALQDYRGSRLSHEPGMQGSMHVMYPWAPYNLMRHPDMSCQSVLDSETTWKAIELLHLSIRSNGWL